MSQPQLSAADRIQDLSDISSLVPNLLSTSGGALQALTGAPRHHIYSTSQVNGDTAASSATANGDTAASSATANGETEPSLQASKEAFTTSAQDYFTFLQGIMARLRRQTYALEEAGIIAPEAPGLASATAEHQQQSQPQAASRGGAGGVAVSGAQRQADEESRLTNGGMGNMEVSFLNSRIDVRGLEGQGELLHQAKQILEQLVNKGAHDYNDGEVKEEERMDEAP